VDLQDLIIGYENDDLNLTQEILLFSELVKSGKAWSLQGHYGRMAEAMIDLKFIDKDGKVLKVPVED
tara:strand:- start:4295 stop:4495 length:201 start_codon:yes stop_codon:yes gene_type:complete